jgi:hypothetical protein
MFLNLKKKSMATRIAPWVVQAIEKLIRGFLWCGSKVAVGGKCVVAWVSVVCPKWYDGLGLPNLQLMDFALRLHWLWLARVDMDKTWSGYNFLVDKLAHDRFL